MKKLRTGLAAALMLGALSTLLAVPAAAASYTDFRGNEISVPSGAEACAARVISRDIGSGWSGGERATDPKALLGAPDFAGKAGEKYYALGAGGSVTLAFDVDIADGEGDDLYLFTLGAESAPAAVAVSADGKTFHDVGVVEGRMTGLDLNGAVPADGTWRYVRIRDLDGVGSGVQIDAVAALNTADTPSGSDWAQEELRRASELGLIPESLQGQDMTADITRAEFAAVAVKVYEALSGTTAEPASSHPFTDCDDPAVLTAWALGITAGVSETEFDPDGLINREQAAAMLTRVYKKLTFEGWTLEQDADFPLEYEMPALFADDAKISPWARDSVYFMAANGIVTGLGNNLFGPRNVTKAEIAIGYANATREQALACAVRMVENLG